jgi:serpin B
LDANTRVVIVNALYLKAQWNQPFDPAATELLPFHVRGGETVNLPTMKARLQLCGYAKHNGFVALSLPYFDFALRFLILVPDDVRDLSKLEAEITPAMLAEELEFGHLSLEVLLPKFGFEPATLRLKSTLQDLGMTTAFSQEPGRANFGRMADRPLYLTEAFHKTFIAVDEKGTEAAAAADASGGFLGVDEDPPRQVIIDRPFFFAIQHVPTRTCLFIGHVTDPR